MKYLTLNLNDNVRLEVDNSWNGKETVWYNGEVVSEQKTFWGGTHKFEKMEDGEMARYEVRVSIKAMMRVGIDIYRNDKVVLLN
ncbi:MAG: hypothetical protein EOP49_10820 [Sphingobacteriales bacterium]|nr:MAG: hypothetical protein EOP49_10820 [Sphingobacteriales bacterium]